MKCSKTALWFSVLVAILVLLASGAGLLLTSTYIRETPSWALQGIGQDTVNLVAALALLIMAYLANKGSIKAFLVWSGVLLYLIYAYVIYAFDIHFNRLFLMYVAILGLSFYALVGLVIVNPKILRVFRSFGEAAGETPALLDRFLLTMVLKRANRIP